MRKTKILLLIFTGFLIAMVLAVLLLCLILPQMPFGFSRSVSRQEAELRTNLVQAAENWLYAAEGSGEHAAIIDLYNSHEPLAQGYLVTYEDNWCSTFASTAAIQSGLTDIIPTECGCQRHIALFAELDCWEESDNYLPLPGDYVFYDWDVRTLGNSTGWSDHVGIVVGTWGPFIKVIEGNRNNMVSYRYILRGDPRIRGYGLPDYSAKCA